MGLIAALAALAVAGVAAACVLRPFRRGGVPTMERLADPLEDERRSLLRSLRDLDQEHADGSIPDEDYRTLRRDTEVRAVGVLRAIAAREGASPTDMRTLRPAAADGNGGPPRRRTNALPVLIVAAAVAAVSVPLLSSAVGDRGSGQSITGDAPAGSAGSISFFEQRVRQHPHDVAARLDLADRLRDAGDLQQATVQYLAALRINPGNAEANASVGYLLYLAGDAKGGLQHARRSLQSDPSYPEGLYVEGVILSKGLHRNRSGAAALGAYLRAAPFGSHREEVLALLRAPSAKA